MAPANSSEVANISEKPQEYARSSARVQRVIDAYERLMNLLVTHHAPEFAEVGVTMAQAKLLYLVVAAGELRMSELAAQLGVSMSTVSGAIDRLVEDGLIERRTDPADRRQVNAAATPSGQDVLERMRELNTRQMRELLERVEHADLDIVERSIEILAGALGAQTPRKREP